MRAKIGCVVTLLALTGLAFGQESDKEDTKPKGGGGAGSGKSTKKSALEEALEQALKNNPDLRVAIVKAAEADAEVARARAQVVQKVVAAYQGIESARAAIGMAEAKLRTIMELARKNAAERGQIAEAEQAVLQARSKLATAEAELNYLIGKEAKTAVTERLKLRLSQFGGGSARQTKVVPQGPTADRLRKALEKKTTFKGDGLTARDMLEVLQKELGGLYIQATDKGHASWGEKVAVNLTDVSVAALIQLLEDTLGNHRVVVREYGLLIAPQDKVPPGAVLLADFLKSKTDTPGPDKAAPKSSR